MKMSPPSRSGIMGPGQKGGKSPGSAASSPPYFTGNKRQPTGTGGNQPNGKGRK